MGSSLTGRPATSTVRGMPLSRVSRMFFLVRGPRGSSAGNDTAFLIMQSATSRLNDGERSGHGNAGPGRGAGESGQSHHQWRFLAAECRLSSQRRVSVQVRQRGRPVLDGLDYHERFRGNGRHDSHIRVPTASGNPQNLDLDGNSASTITQPEGKIGQGSPIAWLSFTPTILTGPAPPRP